MRGVHATLAVAQELARRVQPPRLLLLTASGAHATATPLAGANARSEHGGVVGLARVLRLEHVSSATLCTDVAHGWQQQRS